MAILIFQAQGSFPFMLIQHLMNWRQQETSLLSIFSRMPQLIKYEMLLALPLQGLIGFFKTNNFLIR
ncbi:TPA: hypothetical protein HA296_01085 [Candidatus Woesearchaeota archaeon]|nr:hypothetical protein [Candidatus Woesearchaeota archaeon]